MQAGRQGCRWGLKRSGMGLCMVGLSLCAVLTGCDSREPTSQSNDEPDVGPKIVLAILPYASPVELSRQFAPLLAYLSERTGRSFSLSVSLSYEMHIARVGNDMVGLAMMGSVPYVTLSEQFSGKNLLCCFEANGSTDFQGYIVVREDNPATSLKDLQGKSFASSSRESTMSYILPRYLFIQAGVPFPDEQLQIVRSHNNVCLNVLSGDINAGGIKEKAFLKYKDRGLKVIATSPPVTDHLFVATDKIDADIAAQVRDALLAIRTPDDIKKLLWPIKASMSGLSPVADSDYDALREIIRTVRDDEKQTAEKQGEDR